MECADYERLIHLSRPGERNEREEEELARHLRVCGRCAQLHLEMSRTDDYIDGLRSRKPALPHPELLTDRILAAIAPRQGTPSRARAVFEMLHALLMRPSVRHAYAAAVSVAVALFLYEQVSLVKSLHRLEQRMEESVRPRVGAAVTYTLDSHTLRRTGALELLRPILDTGDYRLRNGDLLVRKESIEAYASKTSLQRLRNLASAYGIDVPEGRIETLLDDLKGAASVQLRLDMEGG